MLPDLIILGAPKSGTTSLHRWLDSHPEAAGPAVKETEYFVDRNSHAYKTSSNFLNQGLAGYERFFDSDAARGAEVVFESAPDYMYQQVALDHLPDLASRPTFAFVLREPAAQIYSLFRYLKNNFQYVPQELTFPRFVELSRDRSPTLAHHELLQNAVDNARYIRHVDAWLAKVGSARVRIYLFDDLLDDNRRFMRRIAADFGIDPEFYDDYAFPRENETYQVRSRTLHGLGIAVRRRLRSGPVYSLARAVYRRLNTDTGAGNTSAEDRAAIRTLRGEYAVDNRLLAERFGLDLSRWSPGAD